jgi:hypothetical protein
MVGQLLPNTNEILQCILVLQNLNLNTGSVDLMLVGCLVLGVFSSTKMCKKSTVARFGFIW